jgi:hypothetical protein
MISVVQWAKRSHRREEREEPTAGLRDGKAGTDHATVVADHRHGNSGRAHGATNKERHVCARRRDGEAAGTLPRKSQKGRFGDAESRIPLDQEFLFKVERE